MRKLGWVGAFALGAFGLGTGCGAGKPAEAVRPTQQTAAQAMGEGECHDVAGQPGEPLIVDWKPEQRDDLEIAMKDQVAVVSFSCKQIKVLPDCKLEGKYGFMGTTRKEQVVQLQNADELAVNIPLSGAKLAGEIQRGSTIDIAMVTVGKRRTTWDAPTTNDLKGGPKCETATHYVRGASIGAFAMDTGTEGKVRAAAEMFGAGASGGSSSNKKVGQKQGDLTDCSKATPDNPAPPGQCGSPIRLVLEPIKKVSGKPELEAAPAKKEKEEQKVENADVQRCPAGLVFAAGKCAKPSDKVAHVCKPGDAKDCAEQCEKGNAESCGQLGVASLRFGNGGAVQKVKSNEELFAPLKKGCDGDSPLACGLLGYLYLSGVGTKQDASAAGKAYEKACVGGDALGCRELGRFYNDGSNSSYPKDQAKAAANWSKACEGGDKVGCSFLAYAYREGAGVTKDIQKALSYGQRACDGGFAPGCAGTGDVYEHGSNGGPKNVILAEMLYQRGCFRGIDFESSCTGLGRVLLVKNEKDPMAKMAIERACNFGNAEACAINKLQFAGTRVAIANPKEVSEAQSECNHNDVGGCTKAGLLQSMTIPKMGKPMLDRACTQGDKFACMMAKKIP